MSKLVYFFERVVTSLACVSIFLMMMFTVLDAGGRYFLNQPIIWAYDVTTYYLMIGCIFLGIPLSYKKGAYIRVSFFIDRLPTQLKICLNYFVQIFSFVFCSSMFVAGLRQTLRIIASKRTLTVIDFPIWPAYMITIIGLLSLCLLILLDVRKVKTGESSLFGEESIEAS